MTVGELIQRLSIFDATLKVYVPGRDGQAEDADLVGLMPKLHVQYGQCEKDDVYIIGREFSDSLDHEGSETGEDFEDSEDDEEDDDDDEDDGLYL